MAFIEKKEHKGDCAELQAVATALWTTDVIAAYKASQTTE